MSTTEHIARYYDRNTRRFLRFGGGAGALAIHRELWGPSVSTATEAKRYVNRLIGDEIASSGRETSAVLDLGCGVGGTLFELAARFPDARMHGVTISPAQKELGQSWARRLELESRCTFHVGDFHDVRLVTPTGADVSPGVSSREGLGPGARLCSRAGAVVAVESLAHASDPAAFFRTAAHHLDASGRLIVVDDFLARPRAELAPPDAALVDRFERGWRLGTLLTPDGAREAASDAGLQPLGDEDLTRLVRLGRPRDRVIALVAPLLDRAGLARVPFCGNMVGGNALQEGIRRGILRYRMLTFAPRPG